MVCLLDCRSVMIVSPAKTAEPFEMPFGLWTRVSPSNHVLDEVSHGKWQFWGKEAADCKVQGRSAASCARKQLKRSTCPLDMDSVSRLGYLTAPTSLNRGQQSTKLCRMFGRLLGWYIMYTFWGLLRPNGVLPAAKVTLRLSLAFSCIGSTALQQRASAKLCVVVLRNFRRGCHLGPYSAGRP